MGLDPDSDELDRMTLDEFKMWIMGRDWRKEYSKRIGEWKAVERLGFVTYEKCNVERRGPHGDYVNAIRTYSVQNIGQQ